MPTSRAALSLTIFLSAVPFSVAAQDLDPEDINRRFDAQVESLGLTRGLKMEFVGDGASEDATSDGAVVAASDGAAPGGSDYTRLDPEMQVNLRVAFAFDSAAIEPSEHETLDMMCQVISDRDQMRIQIIGHTDSSGSVDYNMRLSTLRAQEVARYFVDECGIAADRLQATGMGERFPVDEADPRADENRRVEFQALS